MNSPPTNPVAKPAHAVVFLLLALVSLALYAVLPQIAKGLTLAEPSMAGEMFGWVKVLTKQWLVALQDSGSHPLASVRFLGICGALFVIYVVMLKLVNGIQSPRIQSLVFAAGAAFLLVQLLAPIMLSTDVYAYTIYGRVLSVYHANPYETAPPIAANDPFVPLFDHEYVPSWYGPLWTLISAGVAWCGGEHVGLTVLLFRGLAVFGAVAGAALVWATLRKTSPERATQGIVFLLWNPLVVIETGMSGHNDCVMLALVLLGVWLHLRGWKTVAVVALTLSALVKFLTGMLIPLYLVLVLRQTQTWRGRFSFLLRSGVIGGAICLAALTFARSTSHVPARQAAFAPDFYRNNFHKLIFKGLRRALGEDAESIRNSIYFQGWWLAATTNTFLRTQANDGADATEYLDTGAEVITVARQTNDWVRAYDPASKHYGFVNTSDFAETKHPTLAHADQVTKKFEKLAMDWPTVRAANFILRTVTWLLFAAFTLLCAWRTTDIREFVVWSTALLLASYYLIITEIWPWYVIWAVVLGALTPDRRPAKFALLLSAGVMTLDLTLGYVGIEPEWIATYRSLLAFVLPLAVFLLMYGRRGKPAGNEP